MAINIPHVNTGVDSPLPSYSPNEAALKAFLTGMQQSGESARLTQQAGLQDLLQKKKAALDLEGEQKRQKSVLDLSQQNPHMAYAASKEGFSATPHENTAALMHQQQFNENKAMQLSDRYNKVSGFNSALQEVEHATSADGKGGILTNPDAPLKSFGKAASAIPDKGIGMAEMIGALPKGSSAERQALSQLRLQYARSMTGARMNPAMLQKEQDAMGYLASGDPDLVKKGVRHLAENMKQSIMTTQAGFSPQVREQVHSAMGDPLDAYKGLAEQQAPSTAAPAARAPSAAPQAPQSPTAPPMDPLEAEIKRRGLLQPTGQ